MTDLCPAVAALDLVTSDDFHIKSLNLKDADSGKVYYQNFEDFSNSEHQARVPKKLLKCRAVAREIVFYTKYFIKKACLFRIKFRFFKILLCIAN